MRNLSSGGTRAAVSDLNPLGPDGTTSNEAQCVAQSWEARPPPGSCSTALPGAACVPTSLCQASQPGCQVIADLQLSLVLLSWALILQYSWG